MGLLDFLSDKSKKCGLHGKYLPCQKCGRDDLKNNKSKVKKQVTRNTPNGPKHNNTTVTRNNGSQTDSRGIQWCSCGNRVINGKCTAWMCGKTY